jgi:tetratricopeptide (TPR) repeat protein
LSTGKELQEQGVKLYNKQDYEAAARLFRQAVEAYESEGEESLVAEMQTNIGLVHRALGEYQQALDIMQVALHTFQEHDDQLRAAQVIGNMGGVYSELNDKEQSYNCYRQAADTFLELDEMQLYGETLVALAKLQFRDGKFLVGAATYEVGLEFLDKLSVNQRILKRLIGLRKGLTGG